MTAATLEDRPPRSTDSACQGETLRAIRGQGYRLLVELTIT